MLSRCAAHAQRAHNVREMESSLTTRPITKSQESRVCNPYTLGNAGREITSGCCPSNVRAQNQGLAPTLAKTVLSGRRACLCHPQTGLRADQVPAARSGRCAGFRALTRSGAHSRPPGGATATLRPQKQARRDEHHRRSPRAPYSLQSRICGPLCTIRLCVRARRGHPPPSGRSEKLSPGGAPEKGQDSQGASPEKRKYDSMCGGRPTDPDQIMNVGCPYCEPTNKVETLHCHFLRHRRAVSQNAEIWTRSTLDPQAHQAY